MIFDQKIKNIKAIPLRKIDNIDKYREFKELR